MPRKKVSRAKRKQHEANRSAKTKANRAKYQAQPKQIAARVRRNKTTKAAIKKGTRRKGDGADMHHAGANGTGKARKVSASYNRKLGGAKGGRRSHGGGRPKGS